MNPIEERIKKAFCEAGLEGECTSLVSAERIVTLCNIKGLTAEDVMQGRTPEDIAAIWMHRRITAISTSKVSVQENRRYPLLPFSKRVYDTIVADETAKNTWTFPILLRARENVVDAERLVSALEKAIANHPIFAMHITENGKQWYEKGYHSPYLAARVYTEEGYVYLSLSLNRILGDATSFVIFAQNIWRAYRGEELPHDNYLQYLERYEEHMQTATYQEHGEWLKQRYGRPSYPLLPRQDSPEGLLNAGKEHHPHVVTPDFANELSAFSSKERISVNAFFCLATALAIMDYNETDKAGLTWAYLGRETRDQMDIFGSLHRDIPLTITKTTEKSTLLNQLRQQMEQGILHSDYPFTLSSPKENPWHQAVNVLVQPSIADAMEGCPTEFEFIPVEHNSESYCMLDIDICQAPLTLTFSYSPRHYTKASICHFADLVDLNAKRLLRL